MVLKNTKKYIQRESLFFNLSDKLIFHNFPLFDLPENLITVQRLQLMGHMSTIISSNCVIVKHLEE